MEIIKENEDLKKLNNTDLTYIVSTSKQISPILTFKDHIYGVSDFCQSIIDPSEVSTVSFDKTIKVYDIESMKIKRSLEEHNAGVWTIDYSYSTSCFLTGGNDNQIILWDSRSQKSIAKNNYHTNTVYDVKFSSNDKYFASCSKGTLCIWDVANFNSPLQTIKGIISIM